MQASQILPHHSRQTISEWTLALCTGALSCRNRNVGSKESSRMSLHAVELRFPFTGPKGPLPYHEKQPQTIIPPTPQWHYPQLALLYALRQVAFAWHPPNLDLSVRLLDGEAWFNTPDNVFPLLQWLQALHHSSQCLALRMVILGLCAAVRPLKPIFIKLLKNSYCADCPPIFVYFVNKANIKGSEALA